MRKKGLPRYVFEEVKLMSEIEYKFAEKLGGTSLVNSFSTLMMYYPMRNIEISPFVINDYKPKICAVYIEFVAKCERENYPQKYKKKDQEFKKHIHYLTWRVGVQETISVSPE